MNRGKLAVLVIFAVAFTMAAFAIVYQARQDRLLLDAWSSEHIARIRQSPQVEFIRLQTGAEGPQDAASRYTVHGTPVTVTSRRNISDVSGLVHARHVLLQDSSYDWSQEVQDASDAPWHFGFIFSDEQGTSTILLDQPGELAYLVEADSALSTGEMAQRLQTYVTEALSEDLTNQAGETASETTDTEQ
ncbi:MAG TPA: hypothetical protein DCY79_00815 [Planctomycetaceae bacterium]|nr:hypothetical protein [Blastopirellula sp.]HAY78327.1 hypothetical protein [Planctomycetaceae bacterium]